MINDKKHKNSENAQKNTKIMTKYIKNQKMVALM